MRGKMRGNKPSPADSGLRQADGASRPDIFR